MRLLRIAPQLPSHGGAGDGASRLDAVPLYSSIAIFATPLRRPTTTSVCPLIAVARQCAPQRSQSHPLPAILSSYLANLAGIELAQFTQHARTLFIACTIACIVAVSLEMFPLLLSC